MLSHLQRRGCAAPALAAMFVYAPRYSARLAMDSACGGKNHETCVLKNEAKCAFNSEERLLAHLCRLCGLRGGPLKWHRLCALCACSFNFPQELRRGDVLLQTIQDLEKEKDKSCC